MSQFITETQAFHQNTFNTVDPQICTKVEHGIFNLSSENNGVPIIDEFLSAERDGLVTSGHLFDSGVDHKDKQVQCNGLSSAEPLQDLKIDLNNNKPYDSACLTPILKVDDELRCNHVTNHVTVSGDDVSDIPTSYVIPKLAEHEKAVVGTFVDLMITPGYPYRVRRNGTKDFLFGGKPLTLLSVGQGYGKRLTFHSEDILNNNHYFWSDSNPPNGFALSVCLKINGEFLIKAQDGRILGRTAVLAVKEEQIMSKIRCRGLQNEVELEVKVQLTCSLSIDELQSDLTEPVILHGIAIATKAKQGAMVMRIENVKVPGCGECLLEKNQ